MTWTDLYRLASDARCETQLLDSGLAALARSKSVALHACVTAETPDASTLFTLLDEYGVPTTNQVEAQIVMRHRFIEVVAPPPQASVPLGTPAAA